MSQEVSNHVASSTPTVKTTSGRKWPNLDWTRDPEPPNLTGFQRMVRNVDWSKTSVGPMSTWGPALRQAVLYACADSDPVILMICEDDLLIYNEAYIPLVGEKHPGQLGARGWDTYPDFWFFFHNMIEETRQTGETRAGERSLLLFLRQGFLEETYFSWKMTPMWGDDGEIFAAFGRPVESTMEVLQERRMACVETLTQQIFQAKDISSMWTIAANCMAANDKDLPFAMFYSLPQSHGLSGRSSRSTHRCRLQGGIGLPADHNLNKEYVDLQKDTEGFAPAMIRARETIEPIILDAESPEFAECLKGIDWRGFEVPSTKLVVMPVSSSGVVSGFLIIGLNPRLQFDKPYRTFLQMITDVLASETVELRLSEEVRRRTEAAQQATLAHQKSELKFSRFAERCFVGLSYADVEGKIVFANDAWREITGLEDEEVDPTQWMSIIHEDDLEATNELWHAVTELKETRTLKIQIKRPFEKGQMRSPVRTLIAAAYPDLDEDGNVTSVMTFFLDISEQVWNEQQLSARKDEIAREATKFRNFAERSPHGVVRATPDGVVQFANEAWCKFYDLKPDEIEGQHPWLEQIDEEDHADVLEYFGRVRETSSPISFEFRKRHKVAYVRPDGESMYYLWLLATGWTEFRADGTADHIMFWITDITQQKVAAEILESKMEEALRLKTQQERFIDMISHEIRNPLSAVLHCGEEIVDIAKALLIDSDSIPRPNGQSIKESDFHHLTREKLNSTLEAANTIMYCVQHQKQIVDDVLTLSKLDSDMLVVSPIAVQPSELVQSALKIFEPELKSADIKLLINTDQSLENLGAQWIMLDPNRFLQIVINLITNAIKFTRTSSKRIITVTVSARSDKPARTFARGVRMVPRRDSYRRQPSSQPDGVGEPEAPRPVYLCLSVSDTGKGLTESERALLFQRFAQASPKTHVEYGGSGLGLFISRQITEMLGGEIGVGSNPEGGAIFAFWVAAQTTPPPRRNSLGVESVSLYTKTLVSQQADSWVGSAENEVITNDTTEERPSLISKPTPEPTTKKRTVLVVEDNLVNQKVLCKQLRNRGFVVDAANHGREAIDALESKYSHDIKDDSAIYDCVLCDIEMPIMDGIECVTEIRRLESDHHFPGHVPIIGVTANVRSKQVNAAIEAGMDGVTTKPYRIDELIAHIDRVCIDTTHFAVSGSVGS